MKVTKYGITLTRLGEGDIELVRKWRNSPEIQQYMEYREFITEEMQKKWFESINNMQNFYFIIEYENKKIGLINTSNIDWENYTSDGGIFIWEEKYYETFIPVWASLCLLESDFFLFQARKSFIKTLKDNHRAIVLNKHLGYQLMEGQEDVYNQQYSLTRENFEMKAKKIIKAASLLAGAQAQTHSLFFDQSDIETGFAEFMEGKMDQNAIESVKNIDGERIFYFKPYPF